jgi:hypothetical protein
MSWAVAMTASTRPSRLGAWIVAAARADGAAGPACGVADGMMISSADPGGRPGSRLPSGGVSGRHMVDAIGAAGTAAKRR